MSRRVEELRRRREAKQAETAESLPNEAASEQSISQRKISENEKITMNFKDVDIQTLVKFMSDLTGKNFILDPNIKGQITIIAPEEVTVAEAYKVFLSVLEVYGLASVHSGRVVKIVQAVDARAKAVETLSGMQTQSAEDKLVTQLVPLKHGDAADFTKFLTPLVPKTGLLMPYPETNTLIIIDNLPNIERLLRIIRELDIPGAKEQISIFELKYASAEKLASKISQLFQPRKGSRVAKESVKIIPDERTNTLIVLAPLQDAADIEEMLNRLDREMIKKRGNIHIYSLQNAVAEDVARVLNEIPGKGGEVKEGQAKAPVISKDVQIFADKATNTLVIIAQPDEYEILEGIIKELDVVRTMVYVEALITEVSASKSLDLGVEWRLAEQFNGGLEAGADGGVAIAGSAGAAAVDALAAGAVPGGLLVGVVGNAITLGDVAFPSFGAFISAVRSDSDFNILSTPQILTLDNQEAMIEVGQNIPFVTTVVQESQVGDRPIQTFEYRDVGVTLRVTPTINDNRYVRLLVEESVKSVVNSTALGGTVLAPTTTFRTAKTAIAVKDGETAVIGGLMQDRIDRSKTQTPCLGGAPGVGWLFKNVSDRDEKTNLMVFLSPHIVENTMEAKALYDKKKSEIDKEVNKATEKRQPEELRRKAFE
ncbi:MAG: type II secretion system protein GspD [Desulfobacteraceae bacterium]|nr:MAG: type II secretion system protein GspD [Desulfobacteraceae bacterium]